MKQLSQEYLDYMQSPEWDAKRKQRLKIDNYTCQQCHRRDVPLDVHHLTYDRFRHEEMDDLQSLCRLCHKTEHGELTFVGFGRCGTCGEVLTIFVKRVKVRGVWWVDYTCQDGHIRSYRDD